MVTSCPAFLWCVGASRMSSVAPCLHNGDSKEEGNSFLLHCGRADGLQLLCLGAGGEWKTSSDFPMVWEGALPRIKKVLGLIPGLGLHT